MDLRPLGACGLLTSPIALGTVKLGRNRAVKYPGGEGSPLPTREHIISLLRRASELGVTTIDTAPAYGTSEDRLGEVFASENWFERGRDGWLISTKAGEEFNDATGESRFDFSPDAIRASVERSLRRLRVSHLDIVLLHCGPNDDWTIMHSGALDALRALKQQGKIRAVGASTRTIDGGLAAVRSSMGACDVVMVTYNAKDRDDLVIDAARHRGLGVLVKKALQSGHAAAPPRVAAASSGGVAPIASSAGRLPPDLRDDPDPARAALRFALRRPGVSSVVVGTTSIAHLEQAVAATFLD